jgi:hypothetical protein
MVAEVVRFALFDHDARMRPDPGEQPAQCVKLQGDAAGGRRKARAGGVDEHGAAAAGDPRPGIVVELDDEIVERVGTGKPVRRRIA